ncbi:hypothetical protein [Ottowia testudinis]|uniref:Uncharacterized protein n=1 Tax=Ottowia testudinis TaxID=2816950 RepID=A0A975CFB6_9BURK|nr:hypothetical protein [Ottowia testudinis]QTD44036.1 hypothetical protein J1M35_12915 [Ottowia testudinis]
MTFAKTEKGRDALRRRAPGMSAIERQILIVSNGNRDASDLAVIMCRPVEDEIDRLIALGYLARTTGCEHADFSPTGTLLDARSRRHESSVPQGVAPAPADQSATPRSMAGAKMYLMGVLSLQRSMSAVEMAVDMHAAASHDQFLNHAAACLAALTESHGTSYVRRVARKLGRCMPLTHVPVFVEYLRARTVPEVVGAFIDEAGQSGPGLRGFEQPAVAAG